jgi:hypothetical protein
MIARLTALAISKVLPTVANAQPAGSSHAPRRVDLLRHAPFQPE